MGYIACVERKMQPNFRKEKLYLGKNNIASQSDRLSIDEPVAPVNIAVSYGCNTDEFQLPTQLFTCKTLTTQRGAAKYMY